MSVVKADAPHYVYVFSDENGVCLYVGVTGVLGSRFTTHAREREWWSDVKHIGVTTYPDCASARAAEEAVIRELQPLHNAVFTQHYPDPGNWAARRRNAAKRAGAA